MFKRPLHYFTTSLITQQPMDNLRPQLDGPSNDFKPIKEPKKHPRKNKPQGVYIAITIIVLVIAVTGYGYHLTHTNHKTETSYQAEKIELVSPTIKTLSRYGRITMTGTFGAVPTTLVLDFNSATGTRYYNSTPNDIYTIKIEDAQADSEGNYNLTITDFLDGRIPIGTYRGIFDGSSLKGTYNSKHGKTRQFYFEQ